MGAAMQVQGRQGYHGNRDYRGEEEEPRGPGNHGLADAIS